VDHLETEGRNPASERLDEQTPLELVRLMNAEDAGVIMAVASQEQAIARAIEVIADRLRGGGRLIYAGAGTSGRLGVLDASECPPTFNSPPGQVVGIIAGGYQALTRAVEGAEDHPEFAEQDLAAVSLSAADVLVGIATSGRTPYVLGAVAYARRVGAFTIGLACASAAELKDAVDLAIVPVVGPEVLSGSTRLKAGTATKLVLNMLSTGAMVRLGKTFGNLMVDLRATNSKLRARTNRIARQLTRVDSTEADLLLQRCDGELKTALVARLAGVTPDEARQRLMEAGGQVRQALPAMGAAATDPTLILGIDGGGTHTTALLACGGEVIGRGEAGPSNLRAVGETRALAALDQAVAHAFTAAERDRVCVGRACLGLAGAGRSEERERIEAWAWRVRLAGQVEVVTDAALLLAAGTPEGWGLAVVAGTGSIAWGRNRDGREERAGGWGYLLGDEGSGYAIAVAALQAVVEAADGSGPQTDLTDLLLARLGLNDVRALVPAVYGGSLDRPALAALAALVVEAAERDPVAASVVEQQAGRLARTALAAARKLRLEGEVPLALAGGLVVGSERYRERFLAALRQGGVTPAPVTLVREPAVGAVRLAAR
jgi:N-acetylmuramic acid 6-phosphate etherase